MDISEKLEEDMIIETLFPFLLDLNIESILLRTFLAIFCGGLIGAERGTKGRPAGFRTHILVCLGATLAMMINQFLVVYYDTADPARLGAQVISGIGFLGAGTIIVTGRRQVKGLTTAAGLWACACMGLAIGIGFYTASLIICISIVIVSTVLHKLDSYIISRSKLIELYVEFGKINDVSKFIKQIRELNMRIIDMEINKVKNSRISTVSILATIKSEKRCVHTHIIEFISDIDGVKFVEEI